MKRVSSTAALFALLLVASLIAFSTSLSADDCWTYTNSRILWDPGYGNYCGGTGSGCTECVNGGGGGCVTNGSNCQPFHQTP